MSAAFTRRSGGAADGRVDPVRLCGRNRAAPVQAAQTRLVIKIRTSDDRESPDARSQHKSGCCERGTCDEKRRFQPRQFPISTHVAPQSSDYYLASRTPSIALLEAPFGRQIGGRVREPPSQTSEHGCPSAQEKAAICGGLSLGRNAVQNGDHNLRSFDRWKWRHLHISCEHRVVRFRPSHPAEASTFANVGIKGPPENVDSSGALDLTFALRARGQQGSERQIRSTKAR